MNQKFEREINILDIFWNLLSQWKAILVVALIMMVALTGFKHSRDMKKYNAALEEYEAQAVSGAPAKTQSSNLDKYIEDAIAGLESEDRDAVRAVVGVKEIIDGKYEHLRESIVMNQNMLSADVLCLDYYISSGAPGALQPIAAAYDGYKSNSAVTTAIMKAAKLDTEERYISELFLQLVPGYVNESASGVVLRIELVLPQGADAGEVEKAITGAFSKYSATLVNTIGAHKIELLQAEVANRVNTDIARNRTTLINEVNTLEKTLTTMRDALNAGQKEVANKILDAMAINADPESESVIEKPTLPGYSIKYAFLGAVLGAVMYAVAYLILALLSGRMSSAKEAERTAGARLLGEVYYRGGGSVVKWLLSSGIVNKLRYRGKTDSESQLEKLLAAAEAVASHNGAKALTLINETGDTGISGFAEKIREALTAKGIEVKEMSLDGDLDERALLDVQDAICLIGRKTKVGFAHGIAERCREFGVNRLGVAYIAEI